MDLKYLRKQYRI